MPANRSNQVTAASPRTVTVGTASQLVLPANINRNGLYIVNSSSGHISSTLLAAQAVTANLNTAAQSNSYYEGLLLYVNVTAVTGTTPTLQVALQSQDPVSGAWANMWQDATQITAAGLYVYEMFPGATSVGGLRAAFAQVLPYNWRVALTVGGTTPNFTMSIGYNLIPITAGVGSPVSLGVGAAAINGDDITLFPSQAWNGVTGPDDLWTGAVYAISPFAGATLSVIEV